MYAHESELDSKERLGPLDGLRGVAILLVLVYHVWGDISGLSQSPNDLFIFSFLYTGNTGVTLFFLLSGFLVSRPFFRAAHFKKLPSLSNYFLQRALRILPPYYIVGIFGVFYTQKLDKWLPTLLFNVRGYELENFSAVWWSLITEIQFYLVMPLIFIVLINKQRHWLAPLIAVVALALYWGVIEKLPFTYALAGFQFQYHLILSIIGQAPAFSVGMFLAFLSFHSARNLEFRSAPVLLLLLLLLLSVVLLPAAQVGAKAYIWHAPWYVLPEALIWGAIMWIMLVRVPPRFSLLDNRMTRFFGRISFSLYLIHMPVMQAVKDHSEFGLWGTIALTILLAVTLALALYWLVEKPFLTLKNKLPHSRIMQGIKT